MRDFMPCKGCDEPEACEIEGRCLEPAPGPLRLLTPAEHFQIGLKEPVRIADIEAIQRKFCEVNGLTLGVPGTTPNPCKLTECQGKPRCEKCVAMGLNDPHGVTVAPAPDMRKPLTADEIQTLWNPYAGAAPFSFARAIERAHGIGVGGTDGR